MPRPRSAGAFLQGEIMQEVNAFFDIETFLHNLKSKKPSDIKSEVFSVAHAIEKSPNIKINNSFEEMLIDCVKTARRYKSKKVILNAHNSSKYDNHFLRRFLIEKYDFKCYNAMNSNLIISDSILNNFKSLKTLDENIILEHRYKSSNRLSFNFKLEGILFETSDTFPKTQMSLGNIALTLKNLGILTDDQIKMDFDYLKYNLEHELNNNEIEAYSLDIFNNLNDEELLYIKNDVLILQKMYSNFSTFLNGFSFKEKTLTQNVIKIYTNNHKNKKSTHALLNKIYDKRTENNKYSHINFSDYKLENIPLFTFLKRSYYGGLCFYNDEFINRDLDGNYIALDINSSYPSIFFKNRTPFKINKYTSNCVNNLGSLSYNSNDYFTLFSISINEYNKLMEDCHLIYKKINFSYYKISHRNEVYLNGCFVDEVLEIIKNKKPDYELKINDLLYLDIEEFPAKHVIKEYYEIKENSKLYQKNKLEMNEFGEFIETDEINDIDLTHLKDFSKIPLNAIYGAAGINSHEDMFYLDLETNEFIKIENGVKNAERNILLSAFITARAKYNLLSVFSNLNGDELNDNFLYSDTDSLYINKSIVPKLKINIHKNNIGAWSFDCNNITRFKILNNKIYSYYDADENKIITKLCGVSKNAVKDNIKKSNNDWDYYIKNFFNDVTPLPSIKSILNKDRVIAIYNSETLLKVGKERAYKKDPFSSILTKASMNNVLDKINEEKYIDSVDDEPQLIMLNNSIYTEREIRNIVNQDDNNIDGLLEIEWLFSDYKKHFSYLDQESVDSDLIKLLISQTDYNYKNKSKGKYLFTCNYDSNYKYTYLDILNKLDITSLDNIKEHSETILDEMRAKLWQHQ